MRGTVVDPADRWPPRIPKATALVALYQTESSEPLIDEARIVGADGSRRAAVESSDQE
jgi:hypothetical protein